MSEESGSAKTAIKMIQEAGARATAARLTVLRILLSADHALTHSDVEQAASAAGDLIERVTLYRVLEWLVDQGVAHKTLGLDRVWRFNAHHEAISNHAHFNCTDCGRVYCMESLNPVFAITLPPHFQLQQADVSLQGLCPCCTD